MGEERVGGRPFFGETRAGRDGEQDAAAAAADAERCAATLGVGCCECCGCACPILGSLSIRGDEATAVAGECGCTTLRRAYLRFLIAGAKPPVETDPRSGAGATPAAAPGGAACSGGMSGVGGVDGAGGS